MALTQKENALAVLHGEQPDYYGDIMATFAMIPDPVGMDRPPRDGSEYVDAWGTHYMWLPTAPGPHPVVNEQNAVIKDIEHWEESLKVPSLDNLDFTMAKEAAKNADRAEKFVAMHFGAGLFERSHHLMGMTNALMWYLEYPEEMGDVLRQICEYKKEYIRRCAEAFHPEIIFYHDDWGSKQNLFLPPRVWRSIIKPLQQEISDTIHECEMIYMHHADCFCQPITQDMVELGVDIWQGVIAQNDIVQIQKDTEGKLAMAGGIDGPKIDIENITEEEIRAEVRRAFDEYIPGGPFFPQIPNGCCFRKWNNEIYYDELLKYGVEYAKAHPVK